MPTQNRRIATYLPKDIDDLFAAFKTERGIKGDSHALIVILSEYLGVAQKVAHEGTRVSSFVDTSRFEELLLRVEMLEKEQKQEVSEEPNNELLSKLLSKLQQLESRIVELESLQSKDSTLSTNELAKRLNMAPSTLSHWKSSDAKRGKSPDELLKATREKDPDGIGWILIPETNRFKPEKDLPGSSDDVLQGELLGTIESQQDEEDF